MERDTIQSSDHATTVDLWIEGRFRTVTVTRLAIEARLKLTPSEAEALSAEDRTQFVKANLGLVMQIAKALLRLKGTSTNEIVIGPAELGSKEAQGT